MAMIPGRRKMSVRCRARVFRISYLEPGIRTLQIKKNRMSLSRQRLTHETYKTTAGECVPDNALVLTASQDLISLQNGIPRSRKAMASD